MVIIEEEEDDVVHVATLQRPGWHHALVFWLRAYVAATRHVRAWCWPRIHAYTQYVRGSVR